MSKLTKIDVATGIWWVQAPEADLYVLCGCPADSVKHLMKRGLIVTMEKEGWRCENGPNAILLSDVLIQNGVFANLSEFPVLQMLYRQGMILPKHPNNTGAKPILIGSHGQVRAQMQYIYRGNYGLITTEELIQAGATPAQAKEMMRLKLKFAFGRILPTRKLVDAVVVDNEPVEIKNGVFIRRQGLNVFEFSYRGESVTVDLNLPHGASYPCPYPLGYQRFRREYFAVIHTGDGDGWDPSRPTMSSIIIFQGKIYLVDAGPNILSTLNALGISINEIEGIFHTHAHDDHFCGLAALMRAGRRINHYATPLVRASVARKLAVLTSRDESDFYAYFETHDLKMGKWNDINGLQVKPIFSPHPVETTAMFFRALGGEGYATYAHMADIVGLDTLKGMITDDPDAPGIAPDLYEKVKTSYLKRADLKKLDIGGGLIHGNAEDFRDDRSGKIVLSHFSTPLTPEQKRIGSGGPFGMVDVLLRGHQDYIRLYADVMLRAYFPDVPRHELRMLLSNPVTGFNPESIILRKGEHTKFIYLILTGEIEKLGGGEEKTITVSAGDVIGEISGISQEPLRVTYRAAGFVNALQMPVGQYVSFVKRNGLYDELIQVQWKRRLMQRSWLFSESISHAHMGVLTRDMEMWRLPQDKDFPLEGRPVLYMLARGQAELTVDGDLFERIGPGDFFGESRVLYDAPCIYQVRAEAGAEILGIPGEPLLAIPILRWKLFETHQRRMEILLNPKLANLPDFSWRDIHRCMDDHCRVLFEAIRDIDADAPEADRQARIAALTKLTALCRDHFTAEEERMRRARVPDASRHKRLHAWMIDQLTQMHDDMVHDPALSGSDVLSFIKDWTLGHILTEDLKSAQRDEKG